MLKLSQQLDTGLLNKMFQGITMEHDMHCYKPLKHLQTAREEKACLRPFQIVPFTFVKLQETNADLYRYKH